MPAVRDVTLGTSLGKTLRRLGAPVHMVDSPRDDDFGMGEHRDLEYDGLLVELCKPDGESQYHVWRIQLNGGTWTLAPGLHVGMTRAQVIAVLGETGSVSVEGGTSTLHYLFHSLDGWLWAEIKDDRLTKVGLAENWT